MDIQVGNLHTVEILDIVNRLGEPVDPTTLTLTVLRAKGGTVTTYTFGDEDGVIVRDSLGNYHADLFLDIEGTWYWDWDGTGAGVISGGGRFEVRPKNTAIPVGG